MNKSVEPDRVYPITPDEWLVVCLARQIVDGETVVQGLATPLVAAGYLLARSTHAPRLYFASAIGQSICRDPAPLGLTRIEKFWLDRSLTSIGFVRVAADILPSLRPKEFFRPGQVDQHGNINNIAIGRDYLANRKARIRLPGVGGIPDVTTFINDICLYVPRHSRVTFVPELDVRSGLGHMSERRQGHGPRYLVSDLGQFDYPNGKMRLTTYHPGVTVDQIKFRTGFPLEIAPDVHKTLPPSVDMLRMLREEIDPLGIRKLELLSGADRRQLLKEIFQAEGMHENT
jgi:acyl CoA:acetate/3-ketoacid CoA transferase beta subunit